MSKNRSNDWVECDEGRLVPPSRAQRLRRLGVSFDGPAVARLLASRSETEGLLDIETTVPSPGQGQMGLLVPKTRLFINMHKARDCGWGAIIAAAVYVLTGSGLTESVVSLFPKALQMMRCLSDDEQDLVIVLGQLSGGRPYDVSVLVARIEAAYEEDSAKVLPLLIKMRERGILNEASDGWRIVR